MDLRGGFAHLLLLDVREDDHGPFRGQSRGDSLADALGRARDERNLSVEQHEQPPETRETLRPFVRVGDERCGAS